MAAAAVLMEIPSVCYCYIVTSYYVCYFTSTVVYFVDWLQGRDGSSVRNERRLFQDSGESDGCVQLAGW